MTALRHGLAGLAALCTLSSCANAERMTPDNRRLLETRVQDCKEEVVRTDYCKGLLHGVALGREIALTDISALPGFEGILSRNPNILLEIPGRFPSQNLSADMIERSHGNVLETQPGLEPNRIIRVPGFEFEPLNSHRIPK